MPVYSELIILLGAQPRVRTFCLQIRVTGGFEVSVGEALIMDVPFC